MISSVSEMYPMAVLWMVWGQHSLGVVRRFWLPCHSSKQLWTLAILYNIICSASLFISKSSLVFVKSTPGSSHTNNPLFAWVNCPTMTFSQRVSPVVSDCFQPITSHPRQKLVSTLRPYGMIENMLRDTLERSANFGWVSFCQSHQSATSGIRSVMLISMVLEW